MTTLDEQPAQWKVVRKGWGWRTPAIILTTLVAICVCSVLAFHFSVFRPLEQKKYMLLYEVNHQNLYDACMEVMKNRKLYRRDPSRGGGPAVYDYSFPDPQDPNMPEVIRSLDPGGIDIYDSRVTIKLSGRPYNCVIAYAEGVEGSGTKELIPGLWYYAQDGHVPPK